MEPNSGKIKVTGNITNLKRKRKNGSVMAVHVERRKVHLTC